MQLPDSAVLTEVCFRDGFQSAPKVYSPEEKADLIERMADAGCRSMEIGAFSSYESMAKMRNTADVFKRLVQRPGVEYRALIFAPDGAEEAADCGCRVVKLNISASKAHHTGGTGMTPLEAMRGFGEIAKIAEKNGMGLLGSISLPFKSPFPGEGLLPEEEVAEIIQAFLDIGVNEISLSDAAGMANPRLIYERSSRFATRFPAVKWILHMHNTYGMGLAGILAAMQAGIAKFDTSLAGLGGCPYLPGATGNVATEDAVFMLEEMGVKTGIDLDKAIAAGRVLRKLVDDVGVDSCQQRIASIRTK